MKTYNDFYPQLCSYKNLYRAFKKARKGKTLKQYVIDFEANLKENLLQLRVDLLFHSYNPQPLKTFIIRDPKIRKISKAEFRDRIVHHALVNILEPIYENIFIHDSFANRIGKGTLNAIKRFDNFKTKVSKNNTKQCFVLKADIRHYFNTIDHDILSSIISRKIKDKNVIFLIKKILANYSSESKEKGMPLGNLTSQFLANVYLNELDQFVKHQLKATYYIRYVDDFVILSRNKALLETYRQKISFFLLSNLHIQLHPTKSKISPLSCGIDFLGFRIFYHHKLLRKSNLRRFKKKPVILKEKLDNQQLAYDTVYDTMLGSIAYARQANTYTIRKRLLSQFDKLFSNQISTIEINRARKQKLL